jgi:hypothetical protein
MEIVREPIPLSRLAELAEGMFGDMVKAVVDVDRGIMAVGGELHADEESLLISHGSRQHHLWGINLYPDRHGAPDFVEFDSMINIRPSQENRSRWVEDPGIRNSVLEIVKRLVQS